jgi:hypothetical protein
MSKEDVKEKEKEKEKEERDYKKRRNNEYLLPSVQI